LVECQSSHSALEGITLMARNYKRDKRGRFARVNSKRSGAGRSVRRGAVRGAAVPVAAAYGAGLVGLAKGAGGVGAFAASGLVGAPLIPLAAGVGAVAGGVSYAARRRRRK
jgi:hypothetical protein